MVLPMIRSLTQRQLLNLMVLEHLKEKRRKTDHPPTRRCLGLPLYISIPGKKIHRMSTSKRRRSKSISDQRKAICFQREFAE